MTNPVNNHYHLTKADTMSPNNPLARRLGKPAGPPGGTTRPKAGRLALVCAATIVIAALLGVILATLGSLGGGEERALAVTTELGTETDAAVVPADDADEPAPADGDPGRDHAPALGSDDDDADERSDARERSDAEDSSDPTETEAADERARIEDFPGDVEVPTQSPASGSQPNPGSSAWTDGIVNDDPPRPTHPDPTPAPTPVDLTFVAEVLPDEPEPTPEPAIPIPSVAGPAGSGGLTGNAFGCKSNCITAASLSRNFANTNLALSVKTNVQTTMAIWVLPNGPFLVNGKPAHFGTLPTAISGNPGTTWQHTLGSLAEATTYRIILSATDNQGNIKYATTLITTNDPIDQLVDEGSPCTYGCITAGIVVPGPTFDVAELTVGTDADVTFDVAVSTSSPGSIAGNPFLPKDVNLNISYQSSTTLVGQLTGLAADTTYHIVVKATDINGFSHYAVGQFTSLPVPPPAPAPEEPAPQEVAIWVERFYVHHDGDLVGSGEIGFDYEVAGTVWHTGVHKLNEGDGLTAGGGGVVEVPASGIVPRVAVAAYEIDPILLPLPCEVSEPGSDPFVTTASNDCGHNQTAAILGGLTVEQIQSFARCETFGVRPALANDYCIVLPATGNAIDFVDFDTLIGFRIL